MPDLNLRNKGKSFAARTVYVVDIIRKFDVSKPSFLRNTATSISKRHNFLLADQPNIPVIDILPPSIPANLTLDYVSQEVTADADDSTDPSNVATSGLRGYRWYLDDVFIEETLTSDTIFTDTPVGSAYNVEVSAIDNVGNESDRSPIQTVDATYPPAPQIDVTPGENNLEVTVNPTIAEALFYNWYLDDTLIATTDTLNSGAETYDFTGLAIGQQYKIGVEVVKQYGIIGPKTETFATTVNQPPQPVTGFSGNSTVFDSITATWTDSVSLDVDYISLRLNGIEQAQVAPGTETYDFTGLSELTSYTISAIVVDTVGFESTEVSDSITTISDQPDAPTNVQVTINLPIEFDNTSTGRNGSVQQWTVPATGNYRIEAYGAEGGGYSGDTDLGSGSEGAKVIGEFSLTKDDVIDILVGQKAVTGLAGGGGTFVVKQGGTTLSDVLLIAGGGGSDGENNISRGEEVGRIVTSGGTLSSLTRADNGDGGNRGNNNGGPGAGFLTDGEGGGAKSYLNGGEGMLGQSNAYIGGFGGGGARAGSWGAGGGGGYSGGSASGGSESRRAGGGGGSVNNGTNQDNEAGVRLDHGKVIIIRV